MLFTGDAEIQSENDILASGAAVKSDLLKVGHHGSSTSTGEEFFKAVSPSVTVIMCGKDNSYGHPHKETLQTLQNTELWRTDLQGTIVAQSDGKSLKLSAAVQPPQQEAAYIGNKKSNVFHLPSCASLPAEVNRVYFSDRQQAVDAGHEAVRFMQALKGECLWKSLLLIVLREITPCVNGRIGVF